MGRTRNALILLGRDLWYCAWRASPAENPEIIIVYTVSVNTLYMKQIAALKDVKPPAMQENQLYKYYY